MLGSECLLPSVTRSSRVKALHAVQKEVPATGRREQNHGGGETLGTRCEMLPLKQQQQQNPATVETHSTSVQSSLGLEVRRLVYKAMQIARGNKNKPHWDETFTYLMVNRIQNSPQSGRPLQIFSDGAATCRDGAALPLRLERRPKCSDPTEYAKNSSYSGSQVK